MAWCCNTMASVTTELTMHPCISQCSRVKYKCESNKEPKVPWCIPQLIIMDYIKKNEIRKKICHISGKLYYDIYHDNVMETIMTTWKQFPPDWPFESSSHQCIPPKGPVIQSFDVSIVVRLKKLLKKELSCQWSEMLWQRCDMTVYGYMRVYFDLYFRKNSTQFKFIQASPDKNGNVMLKRASIQITVLHTATKILNTIRWNITMIWHWLCSSQSYLNPHETARYGEIASAILNFFVCCMEMG